MADLFLYDLTPHEAQTLRRTAEEAGYCSIATDAAIFLAELSNEEAEALGYGLQEDGWSTIRVRLDPPYIGYA